MNQPELGVTVGGQFYRFTRHFLGKRAAGDHLEATDEAIISTLIDPDHGESPEGNRTVYWKLIGELNQHWWLLVVIVNEDSGPQVLSAFENTEKGARLWGDQEH